MREARRLEKDKSLTEDKKKKMLLKSLSGKADDIGELNEHKAVGEFLSVFDATYGNLIDGEELLIDFYDILQKDQIASDYLSELYVELGDIVKYNGLTIDMMDKTLIKQFNRGCTDDELLNKLRIDDMIHDPPTFPALMQTVRTEEAKRTARKLRLRKQAKVHATVVQEAAPGPEMQQLQQRLEQLEAVAAASSSTGAAAAPVLQQPAEEQQPQSEIAQVNQRLARIEQQLSDKPQVRSDVFCYRCGIDKHVATDCVNAPNKQLVQQKMEAQRQNRRSKNYQRLAQTGDAANR